MKKINLSISVFLVLLLCINCSKSTDSIVKKTPNTDTKKLVAKDDSYTVKENTPLIITSLLKNDLNADLTIVTIVKSESKGTVVKNRDDSFTYTPPKDYIGTDSFKYKVTKRLDATKSDTATVNITIKGGLLVTVNDTLKVIKNEVTVISNLTKNDTLANNAKITSINTTNTSGTVALDKTTGNVTYTPSTDFTGKDTFTYTVSDETIPTPRSSTATVIVNVLSITKITFNIPNDLKDYYKGVTFTDNKNGFLFTQLRKLSNDKHSPILMYSERHPFLNNADKDVNNPENVILMYTGESRNHNASTINTEHIYPQSLFKGGEVVRGDLHHLRSCDAGTNLERSNYPFADRADGGATCKLYTDPNGDRSKNRWFPSDEFKGDVARMVFYLNVTYGETIETVGDLQTFLKWNREDPVSAFEQQRNGVAVKAQGNRNPFIDNPYLASLIWGKSTGDAENRWK